MRKITNSLFVPSAKLYMALLFLIVPFITQAAGRITWNSDYIDASPVDIGSGKGSDVTFYFEVNQSIPGAKVVVTLPNNGDIYVPNSASSLGNPTNINLGTPVWNLSSRTITFTKDLNEGNVVYYKISRTATEAVTASNGMIKVEVFGDETVANNTYSIPYSYKKADLLVTWPTSLTPQQSELTLNFGQNAKIFNPTTYYSQEYRILVECSGASVDSAKLVLQVPSNEVEMSNWKIDGNAIRTVVETTTSGTTEYLISLDKDLLPGGDGFDDKENAVITVDVAKLRCSGKDVSIQAYWGNKYVVSNHAVGAFIADDGVGEPTIGSRSWTTNIPNTVYLDGTTNVVTSQATNSGSGVASDVVYYVNSLDLTAGGFAYIDTSVIRCKVGTGSWLKPRSIEILNKTESATKPGGMILDPSYIGKPVGIKIHVDQNVPSGETVDIEWGYAYPPNAYVRTIDNNSVYLLGQSLIDQWFYTDGCATSNYELPIINGSPRFLPDTLLSTNYPVSLNMNDGDEIAAPFPLFVHRLPVNTTDAKLNFRVAMPKGVLLDNTTPAEFWPNEAPGQKNAVTNINVSTLADSTIYTFDLDVSNISLTTTHYWSGHMTYNFVSDCQDKRARLKIETKIDYATPTGTSPGTKVTLYDAALMYSYVTINCGELEALPYDLVQKRLSIGWADTNNDGTPDSPGLKADPSVINHTQLISNDTIQLSWQGQILSAAEGTKILYPVLYTNFLTGTTNDTLMRFFEPQATINGSSANLNISLLKYEEPTEALYGPEKKYGYAWQITRTDNGQFTVGDDVTFQIKGITSVSNWIHSYGNYDITYSSWFYATENPVSDPFQPTDEERKGDIEQTATVYFSKSVTGAAYSNTVTGAAQTFRGRETKISPTYVFFPEPIKVDYGANEYRSFGILDSVVITMPEGYYLHDTQDFVVQSFLGTSYQAKYDTVSVVTSNKIVSGTDTIKTYYLGSNVFDVNWNNSSKIQLPDAFNSVIMQTKVTSPKMGATGTIRYNQVSYSSNDKKTTDTYIAKGFLVTNNLYYEDGGSIKLALLDPVSKDVTQEKMTWNIKVETTKQSTPSYDVWLYLDGPVENATFVDASGTTYYGTGEGNRWVRLPAISPLGSISGHLSMLYKGSSLCVNDSVTVYSLFDKETSASNTWQPYPTLNDNSFSANGDDVYTSLLMRFVNVESKINGSITPLSTSAADPSNPSGGNYGLNTIEVGPQNAPKYFPVEIRFSTAGALGAVKNTYAKVLFPKGLKYIAGTSYIQYGGTNTQVPVTSTFETTMLSNLTGGTVPVEFDLKLEDANVASLGSSGEVLGNSEAVLRFMLEPTCDITMDAEKIIAVFYGNQACGTPAGGNGSNTGSSSPLVLNGVINSFEATVSLASPVTNFTCSTGANESNVTFKFRKASRADVSVTDSLVITMPASINLSGNIAYSLPAGVNPNDPSQIVVPAQTGNVLTSTITNTVSNGIRRLAWTLPIDYFDQLAANNIAFQPTGSDNVYTMKFTFNQSQSTSFDGIFHAAVIGSHAPSRECPMISGEIVFADYDITTAMPVSVWNGSVDDVWNNADNWSNGIPSECTDIVIPENATYFPQIRQSAENAACDSVHFEANASIGGVPFLSYNKATVDMRTTPNRWYLLSAPFENMYSGDYILSGNRKSPAVYMRKYQSLNPDDASSGKQAATWTESFSSQKELLVAGGGHAVWVDDDVNPTVSFNFPKDSMEYARFSDLTGLYTGKDVIPSRTNNYRFSYEYLSSFNNTNKSFTIDVENATDSDYEDLMIGNPFLSHLDFVAFYNANSSKLSTTFYVWGGTSFDVTQMGDAGMVSTNDDRYIAPLQAFVIKKRTAATNASQLSFTPDMAVSNFGQSLRNYDYYKNSFKIDVQRDGVRNSSVTIVQKSNAKNTFDSQEDIETLFPNEADISLEQNAIIYSLVEGKYTSINTVNDEAQSIELGISSTDHGLLSIHAADLVDFNPSKQVYLEDRTLGIRQNLRENPTYSFINSGNADRGRLFLRVAENYTSLDEVNSDDIRIYAENGQVRITSSIGNPIRKVDITSVQGQVLYSKANLDTETVTADISLKHQVVIVKVQTVNGQKTEKVLLK